MAVYRFRGARLDADGTISSLLVDETFDAEHDEEALEIAYHRALAESNVRINCVWLTDPGDRLIWSLRGPDQTAAATARSG